MALVKMTPNRHMLSRQAALNRAYANRLDHAGGSRSARLPLDVYSTDEAIVVTAALAGINPEDVTITVENDMLTIRGEIAHREEEASYIFAERFQGEFSRSLKLNVPVEVGEIEATFDNGVLTLVLPKVEEVRPKSIEIKVK